MTISNSTERSNAVARIVWLEEMPREWLTPSEVEELERLKLELKDYDIRKSFTDFGPISNG